VDLLPLLRGEERRGGLLDKLLVASLQRAVPGADHDDAAVLVGKHLRLDVPRPVEVALDEALAPAEGGDRLPGGRLEQRRDLLDGARDLEPAATAAEGGLDRNGQAVPPRELLDLRRAGDRLGRAGHQGGARAPREVSGGHLVAEVADRLRWRADPGQTAVDDRGGEIRVLREKPITRVYGVRAGPFRHVEQLVDAQVRVGGGVAAQRVRLVGEGDVRGVAVGVGVDGDAAEAGVPAGADDPDGDLAAVGDEHLAHATLPPDGTDGSVSGDLIN
jgi:hypothetical protein